MIKQSFTSLLLAAGGVGGAAIFTQTFGGLYFAPETIAISLTVVGLVFGYFFGLEHSGGEELPEIEDEQQFSLVGTFAVLALGIFAVLSFVVPQLKFSAQSVTLTTFTGQFTLPTQSTAQQVGSFVFSAITIPNAEEQFFRGFWGNLMLRIFPSGIAELMSGITFMIFHTAVYSLFFPATNFQLIFILVGAGATFVAVDAYTGDITTSVLAHMGNNTLSFLVGGSIITAIFPNAHNPLVPHVFQVLLIAWPLLILGYKMHKYGNLSLGKVLGGLRP